MGWTQIAQVVLRTIDRLHGSTAQHHPHQDRHMARPPSVLRMPFTTDRLPGGPLAQEYFKQDIGVASPATTSRRARPKDRTNLRVIVAAVLLESGVKGILRALAHPPTH